MGLHEEVLPEEQRTALRAIGPTAKRLGFYLAGGTGTALHLGHRRSVDLDWFTENEIGDPLALASTIKGDGVALEISRTAPGTLYGQIGGVRLSLLSYRYPLLAPVVEWAEYGCDVASLDDLAAMKLSAVTHRSTRKDFYDIVALGEAGFDLPRMLDLCRKKYGIDDIGPVLAGLCYFDEADGEPDPVLLAAMDWVETKRMLREWVRASGGG